MVKNIKENFLEGPFSTNTQILKLLKMVDAFYKHEKIVELYASFRIRGERFGS